MKIKAKISRNRWLVYFARMPLNSQCAVKSGHIAKEYLDMFAMKNLRRFVTAGGKVAFEPDLKINSYSPYLSLKKSNEKRG